MTEGAHIPSNFYRPNQQFAYAVIYNQVGEKPMWFHLFSLLVHIGNCILLLILLRQLDFSHLVGAVSACIYAAHPILTESVSYISGLSDPLGFFFVLLSLISYLIGVKKNSLVWIFLAISSQILAHFSKENMVIISPLLLLILMYLVFAKQAFSRKKAIISLSTSILLSGSYLLLKFSVFNFTDVKGLTDQSNLYTENLIYRLNTFLHILVEYFKMAFWPKDIYYEKPYTCFTEFFPEKGIWGLVSIIGMVFLLIKAKKFPKLFFSLGWFFVALLPYVGIIPLNAMYLEHWIYIPIIGIIVLVFQILHTWLPKNVIAALTAILVIALGIRTTLRNQEWTDIEKFYLNELQYTKKSSRIYNNLAMYYAENKQLKKSIKYYRLAINTNDSYAESHYNLSGALLETGNWNEALNELYKALMINPNFIYAYPRLHEVFTELKYYDNAYLAYQYYEALQNGQQFNKEHINKLFTPQQNKVDSL
ncbi:MAG: tetratricopeptide repeat protein [Flavobacteriales bacterium]|nr:tetratricopeptide repeat protein [Flavobacteriales bacterium]